MAVVTQCDRARRTAAICRAATRAHLQTKLSSTELATCLPPDSAKCRRRMTVLIVHSIHFAYAAYVAPPAEPLMSFE